MQTYKVLPERLSARKRGTPVRTKLAGACWNTPDRAPEMWSMSITNCPGDESTGTANAPKKTTPNGAGLDGEEVLAHV